MLLILSVLWHYFWKHVNQCLFTSGQELMTDNRSNTAKAQARELTISLGYLQKHGRLKAPIVYPIMGDNWRTWKCWNSLHRLWASDKSDSFSSAALRRLTTSRLEGLHQSSEFLGLAATYKLFISWVLRNLPLEIPESLSRKASPSRTECFNLKFPYNIPILLCWEWLWWVK